MHSRIIQLETRPIAEAGRMCPCRYRICAGCVDEYSDGWFRPSIADWVGCDERHDETIKEFIERCQSFGPYVEVGNDDGEQWIIFKDGFIHACFEKAYPHFQLALNELVQKANLETYCGNEIGSLLATLKEAYQSIFDWYIDGAETGLVPFDAFVREIKPNIKYYIGNTADFHF